jgi:hypothetical protein
MEAMKQPKEVARISRCVRENKIEAVEAHNRVVRRRDSNILQTIGSQMAVRSALHAGR